MESLNTGAEAQVVAAPEGHDAEMIARVDAKEAEISKPSEFTEQPPEKILGKFDTQEDLAKAYTELEKKLGQPKQEEATPELTEDKAAELVDKAGLDMDSLSAEYYKSGDLSEASYEALEKAGISKEYVDQYISGVEATANQLKDSIFEEVGGEEQYGAMTEWAKASMSQEALVEYNAAVETGDVSTVKAAVMSLAYRYQQANGTTPKLVGGGQAGVSGYGSLAQLTAAMKDARYTTDPAYRNEVQEKLGRSNIM